MTNSKSKQNNSREIVQNMLIETLEQGKFSHIVLSNTLKKYQYLRKQERAFISRVFMGV